MTNKSYGTQMDIRIPTLENKIFICLEYVFCLGSWVDP